MWPLFHLSGRIMECGFSFVLIIRWHVDLAELSPQHSRFGSCSACCRPPRPKSSVATRERSRAACRCMGACSCSCSSERPLRGGNGDRFSRAVPSAIRLTGYASLRLRCLQPRVDRYLGRFGSGTAVAAAARVFCRLVPGDRGDVKRCRTSALGHRCWWVLSWSGDESFHCCGEYLALAPTSEGDLVRTNCVE